MQLLKDSCLLPHPDHQGPEVADYRRRDALDRLVHPHLLADRGSAQKDGGGVQPGGQSLSFFLFWLFFFCPIVFCFLC